MFSLLFSFLSSDSTERQNRAFITDKEAFLCELPFAVIPNINFLGVAPVAIGGIHCTLPEEWREAERILEANFLSFFQSLMFYLFLFVVGCKIFSWLIKNQRSQILFCTEYYIDIPQDSKDLTSNLICKIQKNTNLISSSQLSTLFFKFDEKFR